MPILGNDDKQYTGAKSRLVPPISAVDCPLFPTAQELMRAESAAGFGAVWRGGVAFLERSPAELAIACTPATPALTDVVPGLLFGAVDWLVRGSGLYDSAGVIWIAAAATWGAVGYKEAQNVTAWNEGQVDLKGWAFGPGAGDRFVYAENRYGLVSVNGYPVTLA